jgi:phosphoribosyl 1,2-cyclic phosphodiesterase
VVELVFLGCGGGRYMTIDQIFNTGGFRVHGQSKIHVDPGPGALLLTHQHDLNPLDLDCIVVTHCHPDHCCDAEVLIEAMTQHMTKKRGAFVGSESVLKGTGKFGPAISDYHKEKPAEIIQMKPGITYKLNEIVLEAMPAQHSDPAAIGLKIHTRDGIIGYTGDTQYFDGLAKNFKNSRVLIANVTRPLAMHIKWHLCSDDLISLLKEVKPELAVIIHMGMLFLRHKPEKEAARIKEETGVQTTPGYVGLRVNIDKEIKVKRPAKQPNLEAFAPHKPESFANVE